MLFMFFVFFFPHVNLQGQGSITSDLSSQRSFPIGRDTSQSPQLGPLSVCCTGSGWYTQSHTCVHASRIHRTQAQAVTRNKVNIDSQRPSVQVRAKQGRWKEGRREEGRAWGRAVGRRRERKRGKKERCQTVIYDLKRQINSTGCLTGPETS